jgi:basic membrane protein A
MKIRNLLVTVVALFMLLNFNPATVVASPRLDATFNVAIVYSTGGLGDLSFNDAAKRGIDAAIATHGSTVLNVDEACESDCSFEDIATAIEAFAAGSVAYDLIIGIGFSAFDGINASANAHPGTNFMIIDSVVEETNVRSITFKEHEGSFLVGAMAAMVTNTNVLGFLGGLDIPLIRRFGAGFEAGAKYINSSAKVLAAWAPDPNNPWGDLVGGQAVAETMFEEGADIVYAAAGGTGIGVMDAAEEKNGAGGDKYYAIGVDSDQDHISQGNVLTSMLKKVDVAVENDINEVVAGTWVSEILNLGLAEDGVGMSPMTYTQTEANVVYKNGMTRYEFVEDIAEAIKNGSITVPEDFSNVQFVTYVNESASVSDDTIPFQFSGVIPAFFSMIAVMTFLKKKTKKV